VSRIAGSAVIAFICLSLQLAACDRTVAVSNEPRLIIEHDVAVPMRDQVVLRADIYRPDTARPVPVLVYRTPYGKHNAAREYETHLRAVERGYAVVLQDVRGRYASGGEFNAYRNEGNDGYDTIEWAAAQPWSTGAVGTYGLSYPGAVQWLAAVQSPPHLQAMVPAMTFSSPRNFFYMNGVFDLSWLPWIYFNIAPDARIRLGLAGATTDAEIAADWEREGDALLSFLPLAELPILREEAPFYFEWLRHPPNDSWWDWAEIRGRYDRVGAAVLNLSGWYDEAYGPEGAVTNFNGIVASRRGSAPRAYLILGPWQHGVAETAQTRLGELDFGPRSAIDYDAVLLQFFDHYLSNKKTSLTDAAPVRYFVMGANEWRTAASWPPPEVRTERLCLGKRAHRGFLDHCDSEPDRAQSSFHADPAHPVTDPYGSFAAHDYRALAEREDVLVFDTPPLVDAMTIAGNVSAHMYVSCDCADFDLWVRLLDVHPDGSAINLMSPGADVQRLSYRNKHDAAQLLTPGDLYEVRIDGLLTANRFDVGHRIRIQVSASFAPYLSRNLQSGETEIESSRAVPATITVHHNKNSPSSLVLPVIR